MQSMIPFFDESIQSLGLLLDSYDDQAIQSEVDSM